MQEKAFGSMVLFNLMSYKVRKRSSLFHLLWTIILMMEPYWQNSLFSGKYDNSFWPLKLGRQLLGEENVLQFDIDTCQTFYHHQKPLSVEQGVKEEAWDPSIFQNKHSPQMCKK